jgi:RimJ/RimL family protein N-acetyltransferase
MVHPLSSSPPENDTAAENVPQAVSSNESSDESSKRSASEPPSFETRRLRLRPWRDTDAPGPGQGPDGDSLRFMPLGAQPGPDDFPAWLARRRQDMDSGADLHWCIADRASDVMLGNVQIFRMGPAKGRFQGELGYWLRPGTRGRGVIGEALPPVIAHAFAPVEHGGLGLVRLHAATDSDNGASQSILRAAGFAQCGADHQAWRRTDGSLSDGRYFELLASGSLAPGSLSSSPSGLDLPAPGRPSGSDQHATASTAGTAGTAGTALDPVTLEGDGIRLRRWRHTDAERVLQACSDERTRHWLAHSLPSPYTLEDASSFIASHRGGAAGGTGLCWCVADTASDVCLGSVAIMDLDHAMGTTGEIGYWAHPDARGRGVMSEAVRLAVRHGFVAREDGGLGRRRLQLIAADGNAASLRVARVNGFVEVGRDRQGERLADGTFADLIRFDLLVDEWAAGQ